MVRLVVTILFGLVASTSAAGGLLGSVRELYLERTKLRCVCETQACIERTSRTGHSTG